jgi:hypothetical protein
MTSMGCKTQQQTLSIRVSDSLREYLDRVKQVMSSRRGDGVSTSEVAKMLLESAKDDRLDHRLEVADLQRSATDSLWSIRQKWERQQGLSHAEWLFLARYVDLGCRGLAEDPERPNAESFALILEAFLAVRALRVDRGVALDKYYVGNLKPANGGALNDRQLDPDLVPRATDKLIQELRHSERPSKPTFCGRNFYVALRDETLPGVTAINDALSDKLPTLFRMAARGHWLLERKPLRAPCRTRDFVWRTLPPLACDYPPSCLFSTTDTAPKTPSFSASDAVTAYSVRRSRRQSFPLTISVCPCTLRATARSKSCLSWMVRV